MRRRRNIRRATDRESADMLKDLSKNGRIILFESIIDGRVQIVKLEEGIQDMVQRESDELRRNWADENIVVHKNSIETLYRKGIINNEQRKELLERNRRFAFKVRD